jgi:hypothetical protein
MDVFLFTKEFGHTQYSYHARRNLIDDFSALRHGDAMVVRTFVLCVLGCIGTPYVGTIRKTISRRPGNYQKIRVLSFSNLLFFIAYAAYPTVMF